MFHEIQAVSQNGHSRPVGLSIWALALVATVLFSISLVAASGVSHASVGRPDSERQPARLIRAGDDAIEFEVDVGVPIFTRTESQDGEYETIRIPLFFSHGRPGEAELPHRAFLVGIPPEGDYEVTVTPVGERRFHSKRILPSAAVVEARDGTSTARIVPSKTYYESDQFLPPSPLLGVSEAWMRNQRVVGIDVSAVRYNPSSGSLVVYERLSVRVDLRGGPPGRSQSPETSPPGSDALESMYRATLLNYEQSRTWRGRSYPRAALQALDSFASSTDWCRLAVTERGVYRVTGLDLLAAGVIDLGGINPASLRLFNGGGLPVPADRDPSSLDAWMNECAIRVYDGGDGRFDESDYVLFYGLGTSDWLDYFRADTLRVYRENTYTAENVYWLTWNGSFSGNPVPRRVGTKTGAPLTAGAYVPASLPARIHVEQNSFYEPSLFEAGQRWEKWWYQSLSNPGSTGSTSYLYTFGAPNIEPAARCSLTVRLWAPCTLYDPWCSSYRHSARVLLNRQLVDEVLEPEWLGTNVRKDLAGSGFWGQENDSVIVTLSSPRDEVYLAWYEFHYGRKPIVDSNSFGFSSPDTAGVVKFSFSGVTDTAGLRLLDVTDYLSPVEIVQFALSWAGGSFTLEFEDTLLSGKRKYYSLVSDAGLKPIAGAALRTFDRYLRDTANGADYLVITHESLAQGADGLRSLRETTLPGIADPRVEVVTTAEIFDEFSWGRMDPGALRDFIMYSYWYWAGNPRQVSYVLLAGDASYDFRNYYGLGSLNIVPAWEGLYDFEIEKQLVTDDFFVLLDGPGDKFVDVCVGRVTARNLSDMSTVLDEKVVPYTNSPEPGTWRNRAILVADDNTFCTGTLDPLGYVHVTQTEDIATNHLPHVIDRVKIYLTEFPYDTLSCYKSRAKRAFISSLSQGALVVNYIGHGSWNQLAHEQVFQLRDVASVSNAGRLPLFFAGSCKVAKFDEPSEEGLGEALLRLQGGGAVASVAATALAFSQENYEFNYTFFDIIFPDGAPDTVSTLGSAMLATKNFWAASGTDFNYRRYVLLGDPALVMALPDLEVAFDTTGIDTVRLGEVVSVSGEVREGGTRAAWYDGSVDILVAGSEIRRRPVSWVTYYLPGYPLFQGPATVEQGTFDFTFVVPADTSVAGPRGRVRGYSTGPLDGAGVVYPVVVDTTSSGLADTTGPLIVLRFDNDALYVPPQSVLRILLRDEHGINATGAGTSGSILLQIDRALQPVDLTGSFRYSPDSYQEGRIDYVLPTLSPGPHSVVLVAYDNLGNRESAELDFEIVEHGTLALRDVINYPNPFEEETYITFELTRNASATIKIFTVSGKLIRELCQGCPATSGNNQFRWDGRDAEGHAVANGVYLYKIEVVDGEGKKDSFVGRAAVLK
ncbi:MAG: type IX secretion system sortase PorU [Candidatus Eiseniibacteriota bacterium]|nr:MAG: type IX secretion system sortase PorU [Candidatus Eisenbacteria bacterium]